MVSTTSDSTAPTATGGGDRPLGPVSGCRRYPVKSFQGLEVDELTLHREGVAGDRTHALVEEGTGRLLSAKRYSALLTAWANDDTLTLPDGRTFGLDDVDVSRVLSEWIGVPVALTPASALDPAEQLNFEMTFDPPDDGAEYVEIPAPAGSFLDCAPLHVVTSATLEACGAARADLDWDVRRFRPNLVLDVDGPAFVEDAWTGRRIRLGDEAVLEVMMPTVRCAMPLRAQPGSPARPALAREPELFAAMSELHTAHPNHFGFYATVVTPGRVRLGDTAVLLADRPLAD